jgi:hypothetical protein
MMRRLIVSSGTDPNGILVPCPHRIVLWDVNFASGTAYAFRLPAGNSKNWPLIKKVGGTFRKGFRFFLAGALRGDGLPEKKRCLGLVKIVVSRRSLNLEIRP